MVRATPDRSPDRVVNEGKGRRVVDDEIMISVTTRRRGQMMLRRLQATRLWLVESYSGIREWRTYYSRRFYASCDPLTSKREMQLETVPLSAEKLG